MEKEIVLKRIPSSFKAEYLGKGHNATCYKTSNNQVFKEYYSNGILDDITYSLLDFNYDHFAFPKRLVFLDSKKEENLKGLLLDYIEGYPMSQIQKDTDIHKLLIALKEYEIDLKAFSMETGYSVYEINSGGLIYNESNNKITQIDNDSMLPITEDYISPIFENIKELSNSLMRLFYNYDFKSRRLTQLKNESLIYGYVEPSKMIDEIILELNKLGIPNQTYEQYSEGLKLIRKDQI